MKEPCPKCREEGKDTAGDNLHRYPDGGAYCHACGYHERVGGKVERKSKLSIAQVQTYPFGGDPERKVSAGVYEQYGVRHSVNGETGEPETIYYPYMDSSGKAISGYKVRNLPKDFAPSVGTIAKNLFGRETYDKRYDRLILTEGEEDCLAVREMCLGANVNVMSVPNGAKGVKSLYDHAEFLAQFKVIYLCFDQDEDGLKGEELHGDWLSTIIDTVKIIKCDPDIGDASDYLKSGFHTSFRALIKTARQYEPEGVVNGTDISLSSLLEPLPEGATIPFAGLQEKLHGLRKAEILTVCAGSGIGKSTLVREITHSLIEQNYSVANVALEDQMDVAANALIALDMNIPLPVYRRSPPDEAVAKPHWDKMVGNGKTFFYKHFAGITSDSLMNKLNYYAKVKRVDYIVLDHLSLVISASESDNERKAIDSLMTKLAKLVVETGVGLVQIVHLKRTSGDKSFAKGGEVELTDLRGSAAIEQLSWSVVGLERDQQGDDRDFSRIRVLKNRTWGFTGLCDTVKYDTTTGRMASVVIEPEPITIGDEDVEPLVEGKTSTVHHSGHGDEDRLRDN